MIHYTLSNNRVLPIEYLEVLTAGRTNIFKGYMLDFRIYDYALTDDEIMNLYNMRNI